MIGGASLCSAHRQSSLFLSRRSPFPNLSLVLQSILPYSPLFTCSLSRLLPPTLPPKPFPSFFCFSQFPFLLPGFSGFLFRCPPTKLHLFLFFWFFPFQPSNPLLSPLSYFPVSSTSQRHFFFSPEFLSFPSFFPLFLGSFPQPPPTLAANSCLLYFLFVVFFPSKLSQASKCLAT